MSDTKQLKAPTPPAGWPRTSRPRSIAILGWARLSLQAREGSGYNLNASDLATGLALSGHRVSYMRSGMDFAFGRGPFVKRVEPWRGIENFDFYNSRNLSPGFNNFRNVQQELSSPRDNDVVIRWLDSVSADVVHIHSLEGFALDLISDIRGTGRPVVVTPHNYWYVCPQVDLLREELKVCMDYDGGRACVDCLPAPDPKRARLKRSLEQTTFRTLGGFWGGTLRGTYFHLKGTAKRLLSSNGSAEPSRHDAADPDLGLGFNPGSDDGLIPHRYELDKGEAPPKIVPSPWDQNERFLREPHHLKVINEYGTRRTAGVAALNAASVVTPPSQFLLDAMRAMGVDDAKLRLVRLGQPHFDRLNRAARAAAFYDARPWNPATAQRPLRFGFLGTTRNNKGLEVLIRAIPILDPDVRRRAHFLIRAAGWDWPLRKRLAAYSEVSFVGGYDTMQLIAIMRELDVGILPHIWFENSPLVMLEYFHAGKFLVSSRLGGPPGWVVQAGESAAAPLGNGVMFPAGEHEALAAIITRLVRGETVIPSPREIHQASTLQSYPDHVVEVMSMYESLLAKTGDVAGNRSPR